jgi:hypothetical protein
MKTLANLVDIAAAILLVTLQSAAAQTPPLPADVASYTGLHAAAYEGDIG